MKAVGVKESLPVDDPACLIDFEAPIPEPDARELLVKVHAVSVNPVDTKRRMQVAADGALDEPAILGFDAAGTVAACGSDTELFVEGDPVWYSGSIDRPGSNAEFQVIDERMVGRRPRNFDDAEAAALPLTALTTWEALFDRMLIREGGSGEDTLLIIGGAGGVGSIAIQIAKRVAGLRVIATASRDETADWCRRQGADCIANHYELIRSVHDLGIEHVPYILNCADTVGHWDAMAELIEPEGRICSIVGAAEPVNLSLLMQKSASFSWEMMSTRPMFDTDTLIQQHEILERVSSLAESGEIRSTLSQQLKGLSAATLRRAHAQLESGSTIGKLSVVY